MTLRLALAESDRRLESVTVKRAAEILGCDQTTVRALLRCGAIDGHRIGKTDARPNGVRVELQSILDYKARHAIAGDTDDAPDDPKPRERRRRRISTPSYLEAMAFLRANGSKV